jgi:acyl carrier protein
MSDAIKAVMAQVLQVDAKSIDEGTSTDSVERWDSLRHMQLILALEDEFGIQFPDEMIPDLLNYAALEAAVSTLDSK